MVYAGTNGAFDTMALRFLSYIESEVCKFLDEENAELFRDYTQNIQYEEKYDQPLFASIVDKFDDTYFPESKGYLKV